MKDDSIDLSNINKHYESFEIPKRSSDETRTIEKPDEELMAKQRQLLKEFESNEKLKPSYFAHAFMRARNIVTAAKPHVGKSYVYKTDIKNFFPNITSKNFLQETDINEREDKELYHKLRYCFKKQEGKGRHKWYLPQGSPTSPLLSNVYLREFDWRLARFCTRPVTQFREEEKAVYYTRYADDIFLSSDSLWWLSKVKNWIPSLLPDYGLMENKDKRRLMKDGQRKEICGIVVNERLNLRREKRREVRAALHNAQYDERGMDDERNGLKSIKQMIDEQEDFPENNIKVIQNLKALEKL